MTQSTMIFMVILVIVQARYSVPLKFMETLNDRPVIGIFTQPSEYDSHPTNQYSYLAASYVKFIESAGARVVPIPYEADTFTLDKYYQRINGLVVTGGGNDLDTAAGPTQLTKSIAYMVKKALEATSLGETFPILAICLGHQALHYILSGYKTPFLFRVYDESAINHALESAIRDSSLYRDLNSYLFNSLTTENVVYYNHNWAVSPDLYKRYPSLDNFFEITALNKDSKGQIFIASTEARNYPIYTVQYHPEKTVFEWKIPANHSDEAIQITQHHGEVIVELARHNQHQFEDEVLKKAIIYNYETTQEADSSFVEIYFFKNGQLVI